MAEALAFTTANKSHDVNISIANYYVSNNFYYTFFYSYKLNKIHKYYCSYKKNLKKHIILYNMFFYFFLYQQCKYKPLMPLPLII